MNKLSIWLKKPQVWGFFVSIAVMAVVSLAFFYPDNFEGNSLMQHDMQQGAANGQEIKEYAEAHGEKPMWTNALMSGMPAFQISPSYTSGSLYRWIFSAYGLWLPSPSNLLFMMMFGFLIMLYCLKMRWYYALIGAIAWGFSSYFVIIIGAGHLWKFMALSFIPPTIGGLMMCYRGRRILGGALTALFAMMQLAANHPQMTYYFAFVMFALAIAYLVIAAREKRLKGWCASTASLAVAGVLAVAANLPNLYNTYEYSKETKRSQSELTQPETAGANAERPTGGLPKEQILFWSYGKGETFSLLAPNVRGGGSAKPVAGRMTALSLSDLDAAANVPADVAAITVAGPDGNARRMPVLQYFSQYFNDSESTNGPVYAGALICALFLLGCIIVRGPIKWALVIMTLLSVLLAWGYNMQWLSDLMIYHFPMYSKFRAVESILVIAEFTMPLLAIMALSRFINTQRQKTDARQMSALYWSFGACAAICLVGILFPSVFGSAITEQDRNIMSQIGQISPTYNQPALMAAVENLRYGMVKADCWRSLIILAIGFGVLWLCARRKLSLGIAMGAIGATVLFDLYTVDKRYVSSDSFVSSTATMQAAAYNPFEPDEIDRTILQDDDPSYRVLDIPGFGSATRSYHHKMVGGYHAAKLNRYEDLIQRAINPTLSVGYIPALRVDSIVAQYPAEDRETIDMLRSSYRVLDMLNTRYIISADQEMPLAYNDHALGNAWFVRDLQYVDGADAEMAGLLSIDPGVTAVADDSFEEVLGAEGALPFSPGDSIALTAYAPHKLNYHANSKNGGVAVFSEIFFPWGWKATIDGEPAQIGRVDYTLRAIKVPAGEHDIEMIFDPASVRISDGVAYAGVSLIYIWLLLAFAAYLYHKDGLDKKDIA